MTSAAKIAANQRNAQKSTGPKPGAGMAKSKMNAVTHGARAMADVVPGEDPEEFKRYLEGAVAAFKAVEPFEIDSAERIGRLKWRLKRLNNYETWSITRDAEQAIKELRSQEAPLDAGEPGFMEQLATPTAASLRAGIDRWIPIAMKAEVTAGLFKKFAAANSKTKFAGKDAMRLLRQCKEYAVPEDTPDSDDFLMPEQPRAKTMEERNRARHDRYIPMREAFFGGHADLEPLNPLDSLEFQQEAADYNATINELMTQNGWETDPNIQVPYITSADGVARPYKPTPWRPGDAPRPPTPRDSAPVGALTVPPQPAKGGAAAGGAPVGNANSETRTPSVGSDSSQPRGPVPGVAPIDTLPSSTTQAKPNGPSSGKVPDENVKNKPKDMIADGTPDMTAPGVPPTNDVTDQSANAEQERSTADAVKAAYQELVGGEGLRDIKTNFDFGVRVPAAGEIGRKQPASAPGAVPGEAGPADPAPKVSPSGGESNQDPSPGPAGPIPSGWPGKSSHIPKEHWSPAYDSMSDPDNPEFLKKVGVPAEFLKAPETWTGWKTKHLGLGVKQIAEVMGLKGTDLIAQWVEKSVAERDEWQAKLASAQRELEELEMIRAKQDAAAYMKAMMPGIELNGQIMKNEAHLQKQLIQELFFLSQLQAVRKANEPMTAMM